MISDNIELSEQIRLLHEVISKNTSLYELIKKAESLRLPSHYIGAGCIAQTVWNYQSGNDLMYGISDFDFVYFDDEDLSYDSENEIAQKVQSLLPGDIKIDVKNEARVHLWYKDHFGYDIKPYTSIETAINTWPTTATSVGVKMDEGNFYVYAPFGLNDLFGKIVRANRAQITEEIYIAKTSKWLSKWPDLRIIPW